MNNEQGAQAPLHLVVWLDHRQARIFNLTRQGAQETLVRSPDPGKGHVHHHAGTYGAGHNPLVREFMEDVSAGIGGAERILILGPGQARHELKSFLELHRPRQAGRVLGNEAMDHGSHAEIVSFARHFFARADRMAAQR